MTRYAILLAVEDYDHFSSTRFCHADAQALRSALVDGCDYATQHVLTRLLSPNDAVDPATLLGELEKLVQSASAGDTVLFFFAGHGHLHANETYLILPHTEPGRWAQTALLMRDVADRLRANERVNIRVVDACHSGLDVRGSTEKLDAKGFARAILQDPQQGWITLAACAEDEYSYADPSIGNGIFTRSLCDAVLESKPGLLHPELLKIAVVDKVNERAKKLGLRQTPVLNAAVRGNVFFAERRLPPAPAPVALASHRPALSDLLARAAPMRAFPQVGGKEHKERLKEVGEAIRSHLDQKKGLIDLGVPVAVTDLAQADSIPTEFRERIVNELDGSGVTSHEIFETTEEIFERQTGLGVLASIAPPRATGRHRTVYVVRQQKDWPASWCSLQVSGDGYMPSFIALFYLIPFQVRALLYVVVGSKGVLNVADRRWTIERTYQNVVMLEKAPDASTIEALMEPSLEALQDVCAAETARRLKLLERELLDRK